MFHRFHGAGHPRHPGSLSAERLAAMLDRIGSANIADPHKWQPGDSQVLLTFDDRLLSQYEIALPVLEVRGLKALWFVYTDVPNILEIHAHFMAVCYETMAGFYRDFWTVAAANGHPAPADPPPEFLADFPFYSHEDRVFRYARDHTMKPADFLGVVDGMMRHRSFASPRVWISDDELIDLHRRGHMIGLHSHTHPARMDLMDLATERKEWQENIDSLRSLGILPTVASYPFGRYSAASPAMLREFGMTMAFCSSTRRNEAPWFLPRIDCAEIP